MKSYYTVKVTLHTISVYISNSDSAALWLLGDWYPIHRPFSKKDVKRFLELNTIVSSWQVNFLLVVPVNVEERHTSIFGKFSEQVKL